jgi:peptide/nickel transport system substrate-binding protein
MSTVNKIGKLMYQALTEFRLGEGTGKPVLVPDLAEDLGTKSTVDGLTFKLQQGIRYMDGTSVKAADFAYAIKRPFAHGVSRRTDAPTAVHLRPAGIL